MSDLLQAVLVAAPRLRRIVWRLGRRLYAAARGEPHRNAISCNGEAYVQQCVLHACGGAPGLRILDIGANEGEWTASLARLASGCGAAGTLQVDVFEPVPQTRARLECTLARQAAGLDVRVHDVALSDADGTARIALMSATGGTNTLHAGDGHPALQSLEIPTLRLETFFESGRIADCQLVKCDTEGHDLAVLRGAAPLLRQGRIKVLQFEYNHRWIYARSYLRDVFELTAGLPYRMARIMPTHIEWLPAWHPELERYFEANFLLVHASAEGWFAAHAGHFDGSNVWRRTGVSARSVPASTIRASGGNG